MMRSKLTMAAILVIVVGVAAAPLAFEQLGNLQSAAEQLDEKHFPERHCDVHASEKEDWRKQLPLRSLSVNRAQSSPDEFRWSGRVAAGQHHRD